MATQETGYIDPNSPRVLMPVVEFVRDKEWKLYSDDKMFNVLDDPDEKNPISLNDSQETRKVYENLKNILKTIKN